MSTTSFFEDTGALVRPTEVRAAFIRQVLIGLGIVVVILALWQTASVHRFVASPERAVATLLDGFREGWIYSSLSATGQVVVVTFLVSFLGGTALGILLGISRYLREVFEPIIVSLYSVPKIIFFPAFLFLFGMGFNSLLALGIVASIFPPLMNASVAVQTINPVHLKVARAMRASPWQKVTKVYIPATALPLAVSIRLTFSLSILSVVIGEMVSFGRGVGYELFRAYTRFDIDRMYALFLLLILVAGVSNLAMIYCENRLRYS